LREQNKPEGGIPYVVDDSPVRRDFLRGQVMLRLRQPQLTVWDAILPPEICGLNEELAKVDAILDDPRFLEPFLKKFNQRIGRPTVPVETYLRLMHLKFVYQFGYEVLVREVRDSIQWRRFCRIPLHERVPNATTLIKLTHRYGPEMVEEVNKLLIQKAREEKVLRGRRLRVDTTVVEADIHHPTDAGLLSDGVRVITRAVRHLQESGVAAGVAFRNRMRSVKRRILAISKVLRRRTGEAYQEVRGITGEVLKVTRQVVAQARQVLDHAQRQAERIGEKAACQAKALAEKLQTWIERTERVMKQTAQVQTGNLHIRERLVSLFDPDARPISKGKQPVKTEFGHKVFLQETEDRLVTGYEVLEGNPADDTLLVDAVKEHTQTFKKPPRAVASDRGFAAAANERALQELGVKRVSLPRRGKLSAARRAYQRQSWFRRLQKWRAGGEATISVLKRKYGLGCSRFRGREGTKTWVGFGVLSYNLHRLATMG
jgi:IS5 family transposase